MQSSGNSWQEKAFLYGFSMTIWGQVCTAIVQIEGDVATETLLKLLLIHSCFQARISVHLQVEVEATEGTKSNLLDPHWHNPRG